MLRRTLFCLLLFCSLGLQAQGIDEYLGDFKARYKERASSILSSIQQEAKSPEQVDALVFLLTYMPLPDVVNYPADFIHKQVEVALKARNANDWARRVPEREWLHFVVPVRVNNENLDRFRELYYDELAQRVRGLSMAEAALEVNHWCHEHVTYQPSDARTSSPLTSLKTATGRCGEESTLAVAALRTVGIPARQVYTPRWAHTDDNHAWVEAWIDGEWHFMGACEPAPQLDVAWFNQPAARGMLMNTTVLGRYKGREEVLAQKPLQTTINVTENYAPVGRTYVVVTDEAGNPVEDATVSFRLYNYAEFYPVFQTKTYADGQASMVSGRGDMIVWASKGEKYGFDKVRGGEGNTIRVVLRHSAGETYEADLTLVPPAESHNLPVVEPEAQAACDKRLAEEDALRARYVASFPSDEAIRDFCDKEGYPVERVLPLIHNARGNYDRIFRILRQWNKRAPLTFCGIRQEERLWLLDLLETLTEKDMRDIPEAVVASHMRALESEEWTDSLRLPDDRYGEMVRKYVLSPRIAVETLSPWREHISQRLAASVRRQYHNDPNILFSALRDEVETLPDEPSRYISLIPEVVLDLKKADVYSKGLLFVAMARTLGVAARIDEVTGNVEYFADKWVRVEFENKETTVQPSTSNLKLAYTAQPYTANPIYYTHFTLSRLSDGQPRLLEFPEEATWHSTFQGGTQIERGDYVLLTGSRMADGSVLAHVSVFSLQNDTTVSLQLNRDDTQVGVIGSYNSENTYYDIDAQAEKSVLDTSGRGYFVLGLLKANDEPSTHILHDLEAEREALEAWGRSLIFLFPSRADYESFATRRNEYPNLPRNVRFGVDTGGVSASDLYSGELVRAKQPPVLVVADTFNRVVFCSQGYTIGIGSRLLKTLLKL